MTKLSENWLTDGHIDFEYKKYVVLAYLQYANKEFSEVRLYPCLNELVQHYRNLLRLKDSSEVLKAGFPKQLTKADFEKFQLSYERVVEDDEVMKELEQIVHFALPRFKGLLEDGREIYEHIEQHLAIHPVGLTSLYPEEGYLFISEGKSKETKVYQYQIALFESAQERYRAIHTTYLESVRHSLSKTYENIKIQLVSKHRTLPNPATFLIEAALPFPLEASLLPVAKRMLVKYLYRPEPLPHNS